MVMAVARRVLRDVHEAEDVFQATFFVLAKKAASIRRRPALAGWSYQIAFHMALKARAKKTQRRLLEKRLITMPSSAPDTTDTTVDHDELRSVLDHELSRLPEKYRTPLVLHYLEGKTKEETATQLGWTSGTVSGRLAQARELLRKRLTGRGFFFPSASTVALLSESSGQANVASLLVSGTAQAALGFAQGVTAGAPVSVVTLANAMVQSMMLGKAKTVIGLILVASALTFGAGAIRSSLFDSRAHQEGQVRNDGDDRAKTAWVQAPTNKERHPSQPEPSSALDQYGDPLPKGAKARLGTVKLRAIDSRVAVSEDGKTIITVTSGWQVKYWDADKGTLRREHWLPTQSSWEAYLSSDGRTLAARGPDSLSAPIDIWDVTTGKRLRRLPFERESIWRAAISPNGKKLAVSKFSPERILLWDLESGESQVLKGLKTAAESLTFSWDGSLLAGTDAASVICWNTASGQQRWHVDSPAGALAFTPDGKMLLGTSRQGPCQCWDTATGKRNDAPKLPEALGHRGLGVAPDGCTLAFSQSTRGGDAFRVCLWDMRAGKLLRELPTSAVIGPDSQSLLTNDGTLQRWDVATGQPLLPATGDVGHRREISRIAYSPDGRLLASVARDRSLRIWEVSTTNSLQDLRSPDLEPTDLVFTLDGKRIISGGRDANLRIWAAVAGSEMRRIRLHDPQQNVVRVHLTADGQSVIVLGYAPGGPYPWGSDMLTRWDFATGRRETMTKIRGSDGFYSAFAPDGLALASRGELLDPATGATHVKLEGASTELAHYAYSPDGQMVSGLVAHLWKEANPGGGWRGEVKVEESRVWEAATGQALLRLPTDWVGQFAFAPDGRHLATAGLDGIRLWNLVTGEVVASHKAHSRSRGSYGSSFASCMAYAPDGRSVATGHPDGTILIWDMAPPGRPLNTPRRANSEDVARLWAELASADAAKAHAASWQMADASGSALTFLRKVLRPAAPAPREETQQLLAKLDSEDFRKRDDAARRLRELGERAAGSLREALKSNPSLEKQRRLESILKALEVPPSGELLRQLRAVAAVERMGAREAEVFLRELAGGDPAARLTVEARAARERLARRLPLKN
jgi:RNA polymerase sigma factor (sigma-70 family)